MQTRLREIPVVVAAAASLVLGACSGGGGGGGGGGAITVAGVVVDDAGAPVAGAKVVLDDDASTLATTAADGKFSYAKVTPPYSLTALSGTSLVEYRGLSRSNPTLYVTGGGGSSVKLSGSVTGPTYPLPAGQVILLGATNGVIAESTSSVDPGTGQYSGKAFFWTGATSKTADITALQVGVSGTMITAITQAGKRANVTLQAGVDQTGIDIALSSAVTTTSTVLSYDPGAYSSSGSAKYLMLEAQGARYFVNGGSIPSGSAVLLPDGGGTFFLQGQDASGNGAIRIGAAALGGTTSLTLPATVLLTTSQPANGATAVSKTPTLSWTPVSGATLVLVGVHGSGLEYEIVLPGTSSSLALPDFTALGLPLAASTAYTWSVSAVMASSVTPDFAADPAGGGLDIGVFTASDLTLFSTADSTFTTGP